MYEDYDLDMYADGEEQNESHFHGEFDDQPSDRTEEELDFYFDDDDDEEDGVFAEVGEECDPENPDDNH